MVKILLKNGNLSNHRLEATFLGVDDGALIKTMPRIYRIPTKSLWERVTRNTIGRKHGKSGVIFFEEESEIVNWILKM